MNNNKSLIKISVQVLMVLLFSVALSAHDDTGSPQSVIESIYSFDYESCKYPVELRWDEVPGAEYYEIEISRRYIKYFKSILASKHIMIFPNLNYKWRVIAYKKGRPITVYSHKFDLKVMAPGLAESECEGLREEQEVTLNPEGIEESLVPEESLEVIESVREDEHSDDVKLDDEYLDKEELTSAPKVEYASELFDKSNLSLGLGLSFFNLEQDVTGVVDLSSDFTVNTNIKLSGQYFINKKWGLGVSYLNTPLSLKTVNPDTENDSEKTKLELEGIYILNNERSQNLKKSWYLNGGVSHNTLPFFTATDMTILLDTTELSLIFLHGGLGFKHYYNPKVRMDYGLKLGYALSGDAKVGTYDLDTGLAITAHVESSYRIKDHMSLALDFELEYFSLDYSFEEFSGTAKGSESLIVPSLGVKFIYDF